MRRGPEWVVVDRLADQPCEPPVASAVELEHLELFPEECHERQKELALQAMLVEPVGRQVGCRHDHHPGLEECRKQAPEDHRIGDVLDLKLVKAQ